MSEGAVVNVGVGRIVRFGVLLAFAAVAVLLAAAVPTASAAPSVKIVDKKLSFDEVDMYDGTVKCGGGALATSAGIRVNENKFTGAGTLEVFPDGQSEWFARGWASPDSTSDLEVRAVCLKLGGAKISIRKKKFKMSQTRAKSGTVGCKSGALAVGGGYRVANPATNTMVDSYPKSATRWTVRVSSGTIVGNRTKATVYVVCLKASGVDVRTVKSKPKSASGGPKILKAKAKCGKGYSVVGGGSRLSKISEIRERGSFPANGKTWEAQARLFDVSATSAKVRAYAVCIK